MEIARRYVKAGTFQVTNGEHPVSEKVLGGADDFEAPGWLRKTRLGPARGNLHESIPAGIIHDSGDRVPFGNPAQSSLPFRMNSRNRLTRSR